MPEVDPAGMFLLAAFLLISFLAPRRFVAGCARRHGFQWLWWADADRWQNFTHHVARHPLRGLKPCCSLFAYAVAGMSAGALKGFIESPYGLVADVKMLGFFRHMGTTAAAVVGLLVVGSVFVKNLWCRYLCPYGALLGLVSLISPTRIRRDADACIDCAKCAKACPSLLPVNRLVTVKSAECTGCLECVTVCPAQGALRLSAGRSRAIPTWGVGRPSP